MFKKVFALLTAGCLALTALSGCSDGTSPPPASGSANSKEGGSSVANASTAETSTEFKGYPMETDTTLTWYVQNGFTLNEAYGAAEESPFHSGLSEMTGVNIEWSFPTAGADATQDFNLMLAGDTLPDIVYGPFMKESERYLSERTIHDLSDMIQENAPAYYKFLQSDEAYDKAMKTDSGKYYGFGFFREDGGWNDTYLGPALRKDWLDEQNLAVPKTISDWDNVLKVFKEKYNAPLSFSWKTRFANAGIPGAFGAHGNVTYAMYVDEDGKIQCAQAQPKWRDYMAKLAEWWQAGLIDKDVITLEDPAVQSKALNGETGFSLTSMGQLSNWEADAKNASTGAEWIGIPYPTGDDGTLTSVFGGYGIGPDHVAVITKDCAEEKIGTALRLLDYAYTDEGSLYWNFGKEGTAWEYNDKHEVEYLPLVTEDADGLNNAISKYGGSTWSGSCIQLTRLLHLKNTETAIAANDTWFYENEKVTRADKIPPGLTMSVDETNESADLRIALETYVSETATKFITGEQSLDTFDDYVAKMKEMGLERVLEIYQTAYDRFQSR